MAWCNFVAKRAMCGVEFVVHTAFLAYRLAKFLSRKLRSLYVASMTHLLLKFKFVVCKTLYFIDREQSLIAYVQELCHTKIYKGA